METSFRDTSFRNSRADDFTCFPKAIIRHANLCDARWRGVNLKQANLDMKHMDRADSSGACFSGACFTDASMKLVQAPFATAAGAKFIRINIQRINLFQGSLRKSLVEDARVQEANLFGCDFYGACRCIPYGQSGPGHELHLQKMLGNHSDTQRTISWFEHPHNPLE